MKQKYDVELVTIKHSSVVGALEARSGLEFSSFLSFQLYKRSINPQIIEEIRQELPNVESFGELLEALE